MLNSAEHETLNAYEYKHIMIFNICQAKISLEHYFHAHKCTITNFCWHFNIYEQENFLLSRVEHGISFITSGPDLVLQC